jgi:type I restriction enzyme R subunit
MFVVLDLVSNEMPDAGYTDAEAQAIRNEVEHYEHVRRSVKLRSGDYIDMKLYEPAMRHLLDAYIRAEESVKVSTFDEMTLVELIVERGEQAAIDELPEGIRQSPEAIAETIENNIRRLITDEHAVNPKYYDTMSTLLDALIQTRKQAATDYQAYLAELAELARKTSRPATRSAYPPSITTPAMHALYDNLEQNEALVVALDTVIRTTKKADWRGNRVKERELRNAVRSVLSQFAVDDVDGVMEMVRHQHEY